MNVLLIVRDLYLRMLEAFCFEPYELSSLMWSLGYTDDLAGEAAIAAAVEVAREDRPQWGRAA